MARVSHEREDLLRDARALSPRVQLRLRQGDVEVVVVAGFRGDALSLYFGDDPAYHFNSQGELRRAFAGDWLIKAEIGRLIAMRRVRTPTEVELQSESFSDVVQRRFLGDLARRLADLRAALASGGAVVEGQVPLDGDAVERLTTWLALHAAPVPAASPRVT
jgi:hypothetical protein